MINFTKKFKSSLNSKIFERFLHTIGRESVVTKEYLSPVYSFIIRSLKLLINCMRLMCSNVQHSEDNKTDNKSHIWHFPNHV